MLATAAFGLTLDEAIDRAMKANSEVLMSYNSRRAAEMDAKSAVTGFFPRVKAEASYTRLDEVPTLVMPDELSMFMPEGGIPMGDDDNYRIAFGVQQPIFTGGKIFFGQKAAKAAAQMETAGYEGSLNKVGKQVATAYFGVIKAELFRESMIDARGRMDAHLRVIEAMYEQGLVSRNDLLKTRVASSEIDLLRIQAENAVNASRLGLNFILNFPDDTSLILDPDTAIGDITMPDYHGDISSAMDKRTDIRQMAKAVEASRAGVNIAYGSFSPNIVGIFNYLYQRPNRSYEPEFYDSWNLTLAASWDIISFGERIYGVKKARYNSNRAEEAYNMMLRAAQMEIRNQFNALKEIEQRLSVSKVKLEQAREGYRVAQAEFGAGLATNTDVLDANSALIQAQNEYIAAIADYKVARIEYDVAIGNNFKER
jgi:outer membrane protein TolC